MIPAKQEEEPAAGRVSNIPFRAKRANTAFACNMGFVHRGGKAIWISEASESFAPGPLMGMRIERRQRLKWPPSESGNIRTWVVRIHGCS